MKGITCCAVAAWLAVSVSHPASADERQNAISSKNEHQTSDDG